LSTVACGKDQHHRNQQSVLTPSVRSCLFLVRYDLTITTINGVIETRVRFLEVAENGVAVEPDNFRCSVLRPLSCARLLT
jgi:hypothetical protein